MFPTRRAIDKKITTHKNLRRNVKNNGHKPIHAKNNLNPAKIQIKNRTVEIRHQKCISFLRIIYIIIILRKI